MISAITSVKVAAGRIQMKVWKIFSRIPAMKSIFVSSDLIISFVFLMIFSKRGQILVEREIYTGLRESPFVFLSVLSFSLRRDDFLVEF